jgi:peptidoglycan/xylan/chitin deacetylase (PgdA/CDA1 family)
MQVQVLMYHRICPNGEAYESEFVVNQRVFRGQLEYLASHGYYTPPMSEVLSSSPQLKSNNRHPILLTFDDGYLDNYTQAFPLLKEFGFSATIFLVADPAIRTNSWEDHSAIPETRLLEHHQIREMQESGIEFGAHGFSHTRFTQLDNRSLMDELKRSRATIEQILGSSVDALAYPYGSVDSRVKRIVKDAGFKGAFATNSGPLSFHADMFEIRRVLIRNSMNDVYLYAILSGIAKTFRWTRWQGKRAISRLGLTKELRRNNDIQ